MTRLFIEGKEIDLDENVQFAITKQFEELSDPTIICNDWSKTVSIPFTNRNDEIFGHIYNPDKVIVASNNSLTGIYFDPLKKLDFRLEYDGNVLMTGYAKMNQIKQSKGRGSYEITLFGILGKVLQEMSKITFDKNFPETDYIIEGEKYVSETYNKDLIYDSWTSPGQEHTLLYTKDSANYNVTDIIGFAPNNSFDNGFDYTCYLVYDNDASKTIAKKFTETLNDVNFEDTTGISPDNVIPDGMMPREIGEYRSYLQLPFIYWNKFFQIFQLKAEELTGYTFDLDEWWFNVDNPYWHDLVYMLKRDKFEEYNDTTSQQCYLVPNGSYTGQTTSRFYGSDYFSIYNLSGQQIFTNQLKIWQVLFGGNQTTYTNIIFPVDSVSDQLNMLQVEPEPFLYGKGLNGGYAVNQGLYGYKLKIPEYLNNSRILCSIELPITVMKEYGRTIFDIPVSPRDFTGSNAIEISLDMIDSDTETVILSKKALVKGANFTDSYDPTLYDTILSYNDGDLHNYTFVGVDIIPVDTARTNENFSAFDFVLNYNFFIETNLAGKTIYMRTAIRWMNNKYPWGYKQVTETFNEDIIYCMLRNDKHRKISFSIEKKTRTDQKFTLNDLWNIDVNVFDEIIRYCKMYRISIDVDDINKTISFKPLHKIFENYKIVDWTNKIDKNNDFNIKPVTFDNKYILFNNESSKIELSEKYLNDAGISYGSYRLITDYNFSNSSKNLFKGCKESITNTDAILSWSNIYDNKRVIYSVPAEIYVSTKDKDRKFVNNFGAFYFHKGLKNFDTDPELALRPVIISDDTEYMLIYKTYCYELQDVQGKHISVLTYPYLDIIYDSNLCTFSAPIKAYTYIAEYSYKNGIYENLWNNYINERYNIQNKILTCYVNIKPSDYIDFKWCNLVKIDNQIYIVNKIYDYDITSNQLTKVDLVKVQDINAYKSINYQYDYIHLNPTSLLIPYDHYRKITVDATRNWEINPSDDWRDYLAVSQDSGSKGLTTVYIGSTDEDWISNLQFDLLNDVPETIKTATLNIGFGGIESISISQFYTELEQGASATFTVTSSKSWHLDWTNKNNGSADITFSPTSGQAGTTTVTVTASDYGYGMSDFYLENNDGDIVMKRVYVPQPYVSFSEPAVQLAPGESTTIIVYNRAISSWRVASQTGNASVTLNPTTGPASSGLVDSETQMTITAGNNTGTNIYTFDTTGQPGLNVAKLIVVVEDLPDSEEPDE